MADAKPGGACTVCSSVHRRAVDKALAAGQSVRSICWAVDGIKRRQVKHHLRVCLSGVPDLVLAFQSGEATEEGFAAWMREQGEPEEQIEAAVHRLRRLLERAS